MIFDREPVRIAAAVRAIILAVCAFGVKLTAEQIAAVMVAVEAVLAVIMRRKVTPVPAPSAVELE